MELNTPPARRIVGNTILTSGGGYFDFDAPAFGLDVVDVVAHALSNLCRFTGHTRRFYSVAEHSVHVSRIVPEHLAFAGLMHDAAEAFVGDVAKPLKMMLPDFAVIEKRVEDALFRHLGLPLPLPPEVKAADRAMLAVEQAQAMSNADVWHHTHGAVAPPVQLQFWRPTVAAVEFLARYRELAQ